MQARGVTSLAHLVHSKMPGICWCSTPCACWHAPDALQGALPLAARLGVSDRHLRRACSRRTWASRRCNTCNPAVADGQAVADRHPPARDPGGAGQRLCQRAALQCRLCPALRPEPHGPAAQRAPLRGEGADRPLRLGYRPAAGRLPCSRFLPSGSSPCGSGPGRWRRTPAPHRAAHSRRSGRRACYRAG